jgi:hypothetical protein
MNSSLASNIIPEIIGNKNSYGHSLNQNSLLKDSYFTLNQDILSIVNSTDLDNEIKAQQLMKVQEEVDKIIHNVINSRINICKEESQVECLLNENLNFINSKVIPLPNAEITNNSFYPINTKSSRHKVFALNRLKKEASSQMNNSLIALPLVQISEVKKCMSDFIEVKSFKTLFAIIGSIMTLLFGAFTALSWTLLVMASIHCLMRNIANKYRNQSDYVTTSRSIQLFMWPYILLAIGNALTNIIAVNGLPEGTFIALLTCWLVWGELKGSIDNAKIAKFPIPPILEKMVMRNNGSDNDIPF